VTRAACSPPLKSSFLLGGSHTETETVEVGLLHETSWDSLHQMTGVEGAPSYPTHSKGVSPPLCFRLSL
jgi:hypothetical protein